MIIRSTMTVMMLISSTVSASEPLESKIDITPSETFLVRNIPTTSSSSNSAIGKSLITGATDGISEYISASRSLVNQIANGDFRTLKHEGIIALLHDQLPTIIAKALTSDIADTTPEQRQLIIIQKIFPIIRRAVYLSLLETGNFGKKNEIYVPERGQIETHYSLSESLAPTLINAILPDDFPLRSTLVSLSKHKKISDYILKKVDKVFAKRIRLFIEQIVGDISPETYKNAEALWILGLSGTPITQGLLSSKKHDPALTGSTMTFKNVWKYVKPHVNHHIRSGINHTIKEFSNIAAAKSSDSIFITAATLVNNNAHTINTLSTGASFVIGSVLIPIPLVGGAIFAAGSYWLTSGILYAAIPNGLEKAKQETEKLLAQKINLFAERYTHKFFPITPEEYTLYHLNPNPSPLETYIFATDYQLRKKLKSKTLFESLLKDLGRLIKKPITDLLSDPIHSESLKKSEVPSPQQLQIEFDDFAHALEAYQHELKLFNQPTSLFSQLIAYITSSQKSPPELEASHQITLNNFRTYPSYAIYQTRLE